YIESANTPDDCEYIGCMDSLADNYYDLANVPDECIFYGCMNESACNYDEFADTQLNNSCEFPEQYYNCDSTCILDTDNDGVCNEFEIFGCTDTVAENYNPLATQEDGSCYSELQVDLSVIDAVCNGGTGSVQLTISGGLAPITVVSYTTYQANQTIQVADAIVTISNVLSNSETDVSTYSVYVSDANGNGDWYPYTIEQPEVLFEMTLDYDQEDSELSFDSNSNTTNFIWSYNGEQIMGANNPELAVDSNGVYGLDLTDEYGCTLYLEYEVKDIGIEEYDAKALTVYPNPANDFITVESNLFLGADSEIKLYDLIGNLVLNHKVDNSQFEPQRIDVSGLSEGTYIVSVLNGTKSVYTRIVIH
ncbi:MAG: T9SS type A sorting domain-containing protein, partial [Methylophagaceae bacterium]